MSADPESVARAFMTACNGDDTDAVLGMCHPDIELHEAPALPGAVSAVGFDEVRRYLERFGTHWSDMHWDPLRVDVAGERVAIEARLRLRGRHSGIEVDRVWGYVFNVRDGLIARQDGYDDGDAARAALRSPPAPRPAG